MQWSARLISKVSNANASPTNSTALFNQKNGNDPIFSFDPNANSFLQRIVRISKVSFFYTGGNRTAGP